MNVLFRSIFECFVSSSTLLENRFEWYFVDNRLAGWAAFWATADCWEEDIVIKWGPVVHFFTSITTVPMWIECCFFPVNSASFLFRFCCFLLFYMNDVFWYEESRVFPDKAFVMAYSGHSFNLHVRKTCLPHESEWSVRNRPWQTLCPGIPGTPCSHQTGRPRFVTLTQSRCDQRALNEHWLSLGVASVCFFSLMIGARHFQFTGPASSDPARPGLYAPVRVCHASTPTKRI